MPGSVITVAFIAVLSTVACSGPNVEATVEARVAQERAIEATVEARVKEDADLLLYENGIYSGNSGDLLAGIDKLSEINSESHYYGDAQTMISNFEIQILERELEEAQKRAQQEAEAEKKRAEEEASALREAVRIETEAKVAAERETEVEKKRAGEEAAALREAVRIEAEAEKKRAEEEAAALREAVRIEAEAKAAAEREAEAEKKRAEQAAEEAEKQRIISLGKTNPMIQALITGELRFYFTDVPYYAGPGVADAVEQIAEVLSDWRPYHDVSVRRVYRESDADLVVAWIKNYGSHTVGEAIYKSHIKVGLGRDNCYSDWQAFDASTVKKILWHEIGHSMGYNHSNDPSNIMYFQINTVFHTEQNISENIAAGWSITYPFCDSGIYWYSFESDNSYYGFDLYVLRPGGDDPTSENVIRISESCTVESGASIFFTPSSYRNNVVLTGEISSLEYPPWTDMDWDDSARQYRESDMEYYRSVFRSGSAGLSPTPAMIPTVTPLPMPTPTLEPGYALHINGSQVMSGQFSVNIPNGTVDLYQLPYSDNTYAKNSPVTLNVIPTNPQSSVGFYGGFFSSDGTFGTIIMDNQKWVTITITPPA